MNKPTRLFDFAYYQLAHCPMEPMMTSKVAGHWRSYSTAEFIEKMNLISAGLLAMGIEKGDKVAIISHNNRSEWNILDHGILQIAAIDVPIYPTMSAEDIGYVLKHSEARLCFVSNEELFEKVNKTKDDLPNLTKVFSFEKIEGIPHWEEVVEAGKTVDFSSIKAISDSIDPKDLATLIYTSGTTGLPKGVMLSHENIASNVVESSQRLPEMTAQKSRALSFLPVCHIFERMLHYLYIYNGVCIYFAESLDTIKEDLNYSKPHIFTAVPRLLEKFYDGIVAKGSSAEGIKKNLFMWAVNLALAWEPDGKNGWWYEVKLKLARKLVFSKVKLALGLTEIKAVASGSAALQPRLARFFNGAGIPVLEGYGLTETSPVISVNTLRQPHMLRIGSVGKTIKDVEVKIATDGEILVKGPNVMMGYYKQEDLSAEVLKDGWFHTGDIGVVEEGFLRITDRKKEMFKTSGGKYIAPQLIENQLKESPFIEQCMVVGEGHHFPAVLVVPSFEQVKLWCKTAQIPYSNDEEMSKNPMVIQRIWEDVEISNSKFGHWEQVKKMVLLPALWTIEGGELTATLKLKRKPIMEKYMAVIAGIYAQDNS